ncbi:MAG: metallophosphatase domain-containing protein [Bacteroidota bacterium]
MRIVFLSDTHGKHKQIDVPAGDLLVHAGDISGRGLPWQVREFMEWFGAQPHTHKVMIAGNHDFLAETEPETFRAMVPDNVIYLENEGVEIEGLKIWGSPITPWFHDWAFNVHRGPDIARVWEKMPDKIDLLITHGPPHGILDKVVTGEPVGCKELLKRVSEVKPTIHVFGHIHEARGEALIGPVHYINASNLNMEYEVAHAPVVVELMDL